MAKEEEKNIIKKFSASHIKGMKVGECLYLDIANLPKVGTYKSLYGRTLGRSFESSVDCEARVIKLYRLT